MISQVFQKLLLRKAEDTAGYQLLGNNADYFEKEEQDQAEGDILAFESSLSPNQRTCKRQLSFLRWVRILKILLPSFLCRSTTQSERKKQRPTAWLGEYIYYKTCLPIVVNLANIV